MKSPEQTPELCKLLYDSYYGEGGFLDGSYIDAHKRETEINYENRKEQAYYPNYIQPVVDSHVNGVFNNKPEREYEENSLFGKFVEDCTGSKVTLDSFMKDAATVAALQGCNLIVIDNDQNHPEDLQSVIDNRSFPYVYMIDREQITDFEADKYNNIVSITYQFTIKNAATGKDVLQRRTWTTTETILEECEIVSGTMGSKWVEIDRQAHNLNMLPCRFLNHASNVKKDRLPTSKFLQPAKMNKAIYNMESEIREIQRQQAFSILTIQGDPEDKGKVEVGTHNALYYSKDVQNSPAFIAPSPEPINMLEKSITRLVSEIYRISCVAYTQQFASALQSGESKKWTFHITRQVLEAFANNCEALEKWIGIVFGKYTNSDVNYNVKYSRNYGADDIDTDITNTQAVLDLNIGRKFDLEAKKRLARQYFADSKPEDIDDIVKDLEEEFELKSTEGEPAPGVDPEPDTNEPTE